MYAIIQSGGKQYKVAAGDTIRVEKLVGNVGDSVKVQDVLLIADGDKLSVGKPVVSGASVSGTIVAQDRSKKVIDLIFRRRKNSMKKKGHRQYYTAVKINSISGS